jgi:hypothetical protein
MYGLRVYITPEDIMDKLCDEDKARFNQCVFTDVTRERDGSITIDCVVFNDSDSYLRGDMHRQRYCNPALSVNAPKLPTKMGYSG